MFPVQILVVLSTMIIINQAATLNYEHETSVTTSYEVDKEAYEMINDKTYYNSNKSYEIEASFDFNTTDSNGNIINSNETALPVVKSFPFTPILIGVGGQALYDVGKIMYEKFNKKKKN
ncbi:unnamed protein product [Macrosiphum euphorbiae]|uniref:Uncharacterized protein n=1 Tax=Macrosiphum euphorbiae TaxID=13131 RepID=A0AAV0WEJ4_9HEMI|nr:unnamed protein product [Macrosiphum euphorbiae]